MDPCTQLRDPFPVLKAAGRKGALWEKGQMEAPPNRVNQEQSTFLLVPPSRTPRREGLSHPLSAHLLGPHRRPWRMAVDDHQLHHVVIPTAAIVLTPFLGWSSPSVHLVPLLFQKMFFIYLAGPGLSCSTWDHQSSMRHAGSLVAAYELLVAACGI